MRILEPCFGDNASWDLGEGGTAIYVRPTPVFTSGRQTTTVNIISTTSCKYPSSGRKKLSRFALEFSRRRQRLRASVRSFISIHQVAPAIALLLLLLLLILRAWFMVIRQVSQA